MVLSNLKKSFNYNLVSFYSYKLLRTVAFIISHTFIPIYLFIDLDYSIFQTLLFTTIVHGFLVPFVPFTGKVINRIGVKHTISLHLVGMAIFFYLIQFLSGNFINDLPLILVLACIKSIPKSFFSTAETVFITKKILCVEGADGRNLSTIEIVLITASILAPLIGGLVTYFYGFVSFFVAIAALTMLASIPLWIGSDFYSTSKKQYRDSVNFVIKKMDRDVQIAEFGKNFSDSIIQTVWPLFIILIVKTTLNFGLLISISAFFGVVISRFIGKEIDKKDHKKLLPIMTRLTAGVFFLRIIYPVPLVLLMTDATNNIFKPLLEIPYNKFLYTYIKSFKDKTLGSAVYVLYFESIYLFGCKIISIDCLTTSHRLDGIHGNQLCIS